MTLIRLPIHEQQTEIGHEYMASVIGSLTREEPGQEGCGWGEEVVPKEREGAVTLEARMGCG